MLEYVMSIVTIVSVFSVPSTLVFVSFSLAVLGYPLRQHFVRIVAFSLIQSLFSAAFMPLFSVASHMIYSTVLFSACLYSSSTVGRGCTN